MAPTKRWNLYHRYASAKNFYFSLLAPFIFAWFIFGLFPNLIGGIVAGSLCAWLIFQLIRSWKRDIKDMVDLLVEGEPALCRIDEIKRTKPLLIGPEFPYWIRYTTYIRWGSSFRSVAGTLENLQLLVDAEIHTVGDVRLVVYDPLDESRQVFDVFNVRMEDRTRLIKQLPFVSVVQ
jgi:hypothetical protein